ncbi:hypothetical protein, partial [Salmonella enterica]|uniref:hypothetical protein n=1 Tax=Salmonella enterica TaxID=28901 RepID=UPI001C6264FC
MNNVIPLPCSGDWLPHPSQGCAIARPFLLSMENPQLGWGFRKAFSFKPVIKTPFDLLKHLAVWQLQKFNK